jgi:hypothetical protein
VLPCIRKNAIGDFGYVIKVRNATFQKFSFEWTPAGNVFTNERYSILGRSMVLVRDSRNCYDRIPVDRPILAGVIGYQNASGTININRKTAVNGKY